MKVYCEHCQEYKYHMKTDEMCVDCFADRADAMHDAYAVLVVDNVIDTLKLKYENREYIGGK